MGTIHYLKNIFKDKNVASVTPSSEATVKRVCSKIDFSKPIQMIEYGPGDGVFTHYLLEKMSADSRLLVIETNDGFIKLLNEIDDSRLIVVHASAEEVVQIAEDYGMTEVDYILSGIPFSFIPDEVKTELIASTAKLINATGTFLAYQTSKHLKPYLDNHFASVETELEIKNIPPMIVYEAHSRPDKS